MSFQVGVLCMYNEDKKDGWRRSMNNNGSSLVWIAVTMVVLLILIGGILTIATAFYQHRVKDSDATQAYFTAKSAVDTVAAELGNNPQGDLALALEEMSDEGLNSLTLEQFDFPDCDSMGSCQVKIYKSSADEGYIEAVAEVNGSKETVVALLGCQTVANNSRLLLPEYIYIGTNSGKDDTMSFLSSSGFYFDESESAVNLTYKNAQSDITVIDGDVYSKRPLNINGSSDNQGNFSISGNIYCSKPINLISFVSVSGDMVSEDKVTFRGTASRDVNITGTVRGKEMELAAGVKVKIQAVETPVLVCGDNSSLTAGVRAASVTLNNGSSIAGDVVCDTLTLANNSYIKGNVTCNTLTLTGSGNTVAIQGNLSVNTFKIGSNTYTSAAAGAEKEDTSVDQETVKPEDYVSGSLTYTGTAALSVTAPVNVVPNSKAQGFGDPDTLAPAMLKEVSGSLTLGTEDGSDSYYLLTSDSQPGDLIEVRGEGNIFLYVPEGVEFNIDNLVYAGSYDKSSPSLYITVQQGGKLTFTKNTEFYGYVYGEASDDQKEAGIINIEKDVKIHGGLYAWILDISGSFGLLGGNLILESIEADSAGAASETEDSYAERWYIRQYLHSVPVKTEE